MELVTGYGGKAHITPENWADLNRGFSGADSYVMGTGRKFEAELISNNLLKIHDGCGIMQGRQVVIPKGRSDEVAIENGITRDETNRSYRRKIYEESGY